MLLRVTLLKDQVGQRVKRALIVLVAANPVLAFADGSDIAAMGNSAATGATSGTKSALTVAQFVGVLAVIGGLIAAKTKKDNPQVKTGHIIAAILFGVCLIVVPEIIKRSQSQVGLTPVDVG